MEQGKRVILLVDDEQNILSALKRLLRRDGYEILHAGSGKEGFELLKSHEVGVILSDQRMPEMTGVEFLSQVKKLYPRTVRIVLSGYTDLHSVTEAINLGAIYKFLTKPWDDELLRENVKEAFERYELRFRNEKLTLELQRANALLEEANSSLEQRVEEKTREILLKNRALKVAHDILEYLPMAVVGVSAEGGVVFANRQSCELFGFCGLVGEDAADVLPAEINAALASNDAVELSRTVTVAGQDYQLRKCPLSEKNAMNGCVLLFLPL